MINKPLHVVLKTPELWDSSVKNVNKNIQAAIATLFYIVS